MREADFTPEERAQLRSFGIELFAERVIFEAQPPMTETDIAAVAARCRGPLPPDLLELWRQTAGGSLDYELHLPMDGNLEAVSWTELFYNGAQTYNDLQGWIGHELDLLEGADKLAFLPIGGFEYCDRIYVDTVGGGGVVAWKQGMPPGWTDALHADGVTRFAPSLRAAFGALCLSGDPLAPVEDFFAGQTLLDYLEERAVPEPLRGRLLDFYREARLDWAAALAAERLSDSPAETRAALMHAVHSDDADLALRLVQNGVSLKRALAGSGLPLETALTRHAYKVAAVWLKAGAPLPQQAFARFDKQPPTDLTQALLAAGAVPVWDDVARFAALGATEEARLLAQRLDYGEWLTVRGKWLSELRDKLARVRSKKLGHYLGERGLAERLERLEQFELA